MGCRLARAYISSTMVDLASVLITLPIDMKNLTACQSCSLPYADKINHVEELLYPKVAPEPSMYCPRVLIGPLGPAPYLMMLKPPSGL